MPESRSGFRDPENSIRRYARPADGRAGGGGEGRKGLNESQLLHVRGMCQKSLLPLERRRRGGTTEQVLIMDDRGGDRFFSTGEFD
jgi:hypothetical protein